MHIFLTNKMNLQRAHARITNRHKPPTEMFYRPAETPQQVSIELYLLLTMVHVIVIYTFL